jgi:hypothetical protein
MDTLNEDVQMDDVENRHITRLQDKYAKLEQKILRIEKEMNKRQSAESKLIEFAMNETKFIEVIKEQEERATYLSNRLQSFINRECVLTEVSRYVRSLGSADLIVHFHLQLMRAYNWNDDFWEQSKSSLYTIPEWLDLIMKVDDPMPEEAMQSQLFEVI